MTVYREQNLAVSSNDARFPADPVTLTFGGGTIQMTEEEASWLASNIQRELRYRDRGKSAALTAEEKRCLRVGDVVTYVDDNGDSCSRKVRMEPWQLGHGKYVIGLEGISGGYSLDRVTGLISRAEAKPT